MIINKNKLQLKDLNFIDLFCGIGGFRLALNSFGAKCLFSSDFDKDCQKIYELNFKEKPYGDITKININEIPNHDLLSAGIGDLGKQHDQTNRSWDTNRFLALSTKSVTETFSEPLTVTVGAPYLSNGTGVPHRVFEKYQEIVCFV